MAFTLTVKNNLKNINKFFREQIIHNNIYFTESAIHGMEFEKFCATNEKS